MPLRPDAKRIALTVVFILLSMFYARQESGFPFRIEWVWHDQPIYHTLSPITHIGLPWSYFSKGKFNAPPQYKSGFAFFACDKTACVFDLPSSQRVFLYHYNILLNLIFWYCAACLAIFVYKRFKKRAHGAVG